MAVERRRQTAPTAASVADHEEARAVPRAAEKTRQTPPAWGREAAWAIGAAAIASVVAVWALRLWDGWAPTRPIASGGDANFYLAHVKGTLEHGWYLHNPDVGAPFGLDMHDFPSLSNDALQLVIVKLLGVFFSNVHTVVNAFFLLGFPLTAIIAFAALRLLGVSRLPALIAAVLYATTPFHFLRGEAHLFYSSYYLVPLSCVLVLAVMAGKPVFTRREGAGGLRAWATGRTFAVLVLCALIAIASIYYAVFTMLLMGAATMLRAIAVGRVRTLATGAVVVAMIAAVAVIAQTPTIIYRLDHGKNPIVAARAPAESEMYGLKLVHLVFPVEGHRLEPFARVTNNHLATSPVRGESLGYLGAAGTVGLAWLLLVGLGAAAATGGRRLGTQLERHAAVSALVAFLLGTVGGGSVIIAHGVTAQIRGWERISIFIAFFALLALALLLQRLLDRARTPSRRRVITAVLGAVLVVALVDQTSPRFALDHDAIRAAYTSDARFVREAEQRLPPGSMVLQLPYTPFPEAGQWPGAGDYQHMAAYLQSAALRWSYGAMRGRPEDWHASVADVPLRALLDGVTASGFAAVQIDRRGYSDRAAALEAALNSLLGPGLVSSEDGNMLLWDLRPRADQLPAARRAALTDVTLRPVRVAPGIGMGVFERSGADTWRWAEANGEIVLENPGRTPRRMLFDAVLRTEAAEPGTTTVTFPDGSTQRVTIDDEGTRVSRAFDAPSGPSAVRFDTAGTQVPTPPTDLRRLFLQLRRPVVMPEALCRQPASSLRAVRECAQGSQAQVR